MGKANAITIAQKRKIYAVSREIGMDNDLLHSIVKNKCKKEHISDLTMKQAAQVIDYLEGRKGTETRSIKLPSGRSVPLVTEKQLWKINQLALELGWQDNPKRLRGFCSKYTDIDNPEWMTVDQAWRIIEGLKSLVAQAATKGGGTGGESADRLLDERH